MRIKVCGMRDAGNLRALDKLPVDWIGLIFYDKSPRFVEQGGKIRRHLKKKRVFKKVGVFVNADLEYVKAKAELYQLDYLQLHGNENLFYCRQLEEAGYRIIKAFSVDDDFCFTNTEGYQFFCDYFLFDTKGLQPGGNGIPFNWEVLNKYKGRTPFLLSGGINPKSTDALKKIDHPRLFGLDLNSGFERAPAMKDIRKLNVFLNKLNPIKDIQA